MPLFLLLFLLLSSFLFRFPSQPRRRPRPRRHTLPRPPLLRLQLIPLRPLPRQNRKNKIRSMSLQIRLRLMNQPPLLIQLPRILRLFYFLDALLFGQIWLCRRRRRRRALGGDYLIMIDVIVVEYPRAAFYFPKPGQGFVDGGGRGVDASEAFFVETDALAPDFDAFGCYFDHFDVEPVHCAEGCDGSLDLFDAGGEGAEVN